MSMGTRGNRADRKAPVETEPARKAPVKTWASKRAPVKTKTYCLQVKDPPGGGTGDVGMQWD